MNRTILILLGCVLSVSASDLPGILVRQAGTVVDSLRGGTLTWPERPEAEPGGDWRMPPWLPTANPFGGFYQLWGRSAEPAIKALAGPADLLALPDITWAMVNPEPGVVDLGLLERGIPGDKIGLAELRRLGRQGIVWFMAWRGADAPEWVVRKHRLRALTFRNHDTGADLLPVWRPGPRDDLLATVAAIGDRLRNEPGLGRVQIPAMGNRSGEFYPSKGLLEAIVKDGIQPDGDFLDFHLGWQDTWAKHLGVDKGIWISIDAPFDGRHRSEDGDRRERRAWRRMVDHALALGFGSRSGGTDSISNHVGNCWIQDIDPSGRAMSRLLPLSFWGNEAEEFLAPAFPYFEQMLLTGVSQGFTHTLVDDAMLMRLAGHPEAAAVFDERYAVMLRAVLQTSGWLPEHAPHALVALGEMDVRDERLIGRDTPWPRTKGVRSVMANHAWLVQQVEVDGCRSVPDLRRDWRLEDADVAAMRTAYRRLAAAFPWCRAKHMERQLSGLKGADATRALCNGLLGLTLEDGLTHTYAGRRTDHARGQHGLAFRFAPRFVAGGAPDLVVQVTWRNDGTAWDLVWNAADGERRLTAPRPPADGKLWTASFGLRGLVAGGVVPDLVLRRSAGPDLCVQQLRVVRWQVPTNLAAGMPALVADRERLLAARRAEELTAITAANTAADSQESQRRTADVTQVSGWTTRLNHLRDQVLADPTKAAARSGLDLATLRTRYEAALDLATRGRPEAADAIADLERLLAR